jgi:hypothetical protein
MILNYCIIIVKSTKFEHYTLNCSIGEILYGKSFPGGNATFRIAWSFFGSVDYKIIKEILPIVIKQGNSAGECFINAPEGQVDGYLLS